ncbi:MAG: DUF192 domain-containing protein [Gammaproteobacteria bacterium]|nr:DUF192 domain-containing protein [Gammaproteobacteria bacterium]
MKLRPLRVKLAQRYADRLCGVGLGVTWREFDALCLPRCRAVHTLGLARPIDVVFVSDDAVIVEIRPRVPPWRIVIARVSNAVDTWEFPADSCQAHRVTCGSSIEAMLSQMTPIANA